MFIKSGHNPLWWSVPTSELMQILGSTSQGLSHQEAQQRLNEGIKNTPKTPQTSPVLRLLVAQFASPITIILIFAAILSFFLHDHLNATIILGIVVVSGGLGFWQERGAADAVAQLLSLVQIKATVRRQSEKIEIPAGEVVPGDIVLLSAGNKIPADCLLLDSRDLYVNEAALTGETYPAEKSVGVLPLETALNGRSNSLFMGTNVVSGSATAVVASVGRETEFGKVSAHLTAPVPETEFERGIRHFGYLLGEVTLLLVLGIFAVNVFLNRPVLDSFLFALALAVGLTPQLLPAIISINLAHGAKRMAEGKVIVKRLASIENFGSMNVLCSDKTGTLTEGKVTLQGTLDMDGRHSDKVFLNAYLNAALETGFNNPIDAAILAHQSLDVSGYRKLDEIPYDFNRKRLTVAVAADSGRFMITKGALSNVLEVCTQAETSRGLVDLSAVRDQIEKQFAGFSQSGLRTLGVAWRMLPDDQNLPALGGEEEKEMTFLGFVVLADPPKTDIRATVEQLGELGIALKMITGDNRLVAAHVGEHVGLHPSGLLSGSELNRLSDEALRQRVQKCDIFAEIEPNQKERIILALRKAGNVVGYMGDGINDVSALHSADIGISVASAVDVAKEAAAIVLLEQDMGVLVQGVREGRVTFANTLKYVFMATSANFGNMFSMAGASLFLPFLPLLPKQILLTNLLTDFPEMTIATDSVDPEMVSFPRRWDIGFIRRFMLAFGLLSSIFDYLTFGILRLALHAGPVEFRTGWFLESVISASLIVLVIRTKRPFFQSRPGRYLLVATLSVGLLTLLISFTPLGHVFGFGALPLLFVFSMGVIMALYTGTAEITKYYFYQREASRAEVTA